MPQDFRDSPTEFALSQSLFDMRMPSEKMTDWLSNSDMRMSQRLVAIEIVRIGRFV